MIIAILEDDKDFAQYLYEQLQRWAASGCHGIEVEICSNTEALRRCLEMNPSVDAVFFDIILGDTAQGFDVARELYARGSDISIVFVTSSPDYVYEGYKVEALRYMRKPIDENALADCLDTIARKISMRDSGTLVVQTRSDEFHFAFHDIYYVESRRNHCDLHIMDEIYDIPWSMKHFETELPAQFIRIQRSFIVNIEHVVALRSNEAVLRNGERLSIGRKYLEEVRWTFRCSVMK